MYSRVPPSLSVGSGLKVISRAFLRHCFLLAPIGWLAVTTPLQAVTPAPDGGYAGNNTAEGTSSLFSLTSGTNNTAIGFQALNHNTSGSNNTASGMNALFNNTIGNFNLANGVQALFHNTSGSYNMANGIGALFSNTTGNYNVASGVNSLFNNTTGVGNTANGISALFSNIDGSNNTAIGFLALTNNVSGGANTAIGVQALNNNIGTSNTALGFQALSLNTQGNGNIAIGEDAGINITTGSSNICIGNDGNAGESGKIRIGTSGMHTDTYLTGIIHAGALEVPAGEENLRIVRGVVSGGGGLLVGAGFTVSKGAAGSGQYTITFNTPFVGAPAVTATADLDGRIISTVGVTSSSANVQISLAGGGHTDAAFHVIAIGPR
jgi:hypothetical protein